MNPLPGPETGRRATQFQAAINVLTRHVLSVVRFRPCVGGRVTPREHGDDIPVLLSPEMAAEEVVHYYGDDLALHLNRSGRRGARD